MENRARPYPPCIPVWRPADRSRRWRLHADPPEPSARPSRDPPSRCLSTATSHRFSGSILPIRQPSSPGDGRAPGGSHEQIALPHPPSHRSFSRSAARGGGGGGRTGRRQRRPRPASSGSQVIGDVVTTDNDAVDLRVARGADGTVYLCGVYDCPLFSGYLWAARYAANGNQIWLQKYGESLGIDANATAIAVDRYGNLIVVGRAEVAGNGDIAGPQVRPRRHAALGPHSSTASAAARTTPRRGRRPRRRRLRGRRQHRRRHRPRLPGHQVQRRRRLPLGVALRRSRAPTTCRTRSPSTASARRYVTGVSASAAGDSRTSSPSRSIPPERVAGRSAGRRQPPRRPRPRHRLRRRRASTSPARPPLRHADSDFVLLGTRPAARAAGSRTWDGPAHDSTTPPASGRRRPGQRLGRRLGRQRAGFHQRPRSSSGTPTGRRQWARRRHARGTVLDSAFNDVAIDAAGNGLVRRRPAEDPGPGRRARRAGTRPSGTRQWLRRWNGPADRLRRRHGALSVGHHVALRRRLDVRAGQRA